VDSTLQAGISLVGDQDVQIVEAKRGAKRVTLLQGLTSTMEDRKKLLKELKSKLGGGGAMIEGVVSLISCSCFSIRYIHHYPIADV
jgi:translation initiation factor 1 (eIF-1/SUI1)